MSCAYCTNVGKYQYKGVILCFAHLLGARQTVSGLLRYPIYGQETPPLQYPLRHLLPSTELHFRRLS